MRTKNERNKKTILLNNEFYKLFNKIKISSLQWEINWVSISNIVYRAKYHWIMNIDRLKAIIELINKWVNIGWFIKKPLNELDYKNFIK